MYVVLFDKKVQCVHLFILSKCLNRKKFYELSYSSMHSSLVWFWCWSHSESLTIRTKHRTLKNWLHYITSCLKKKYLVNLPILKNDTHDRLDRSSKRIWWLFYSLVVKILRWRQKKVKRWQWWFLRRTLLYNFGSKVLYSKICEYENKMLGFEKKFDNTWWIKNTNESKKKKYRLEEREKKDLINIWNKL